MLADSRSALEEKEAPLYHPGPLIQDLHQFSECGTIYGTAGIKAGLNAGDEILQLNGKNSSTLTFSDMKAAFSQASLSLTVNTLPPVDRRQHCFLPPRRSDSVQHLYTDIFSQNQEEILDDGVGLISETSGDSLDDDSELFSEYDDYRKAVLSTAANLLRVK
ncbi:hypothetical protein MHYP_G00206010 [Metynnis hypsauchen]